MKIIAIIQARMGSTRLPGKTMMDVVGKPLLWHVLERIKNTKKIDGILVATTVLDEDDVIESFVKNEGLEIFRGSKDDVLDRYYKAAKENNADIVVRVTADCPLLDPQIIDEMIDKFLGSDIDYLSNNKPPTYPHGLDAEVFTFQSLEKAWEEAKLDSEREHVTPYIWKNPENFRMMNFSQEVDQSDFRWTVDRAEDLEVVRKIYTYLGEKGRNHRFNYRDVLTIYEEHPELRSLNMGIDRMEGYKKSLKEDSEIK